MIGTSFVRSTLLAASVLLLLWRVAAQNGETSPFGVTARLSPTHVELQLTLPMFCLSLRAYAFNAARGPILSFCSNCHPQRSGYNWS